MHGRFAATTPVELAHAACNPLKLTRWLLAQSTHSRMPLHPTASCGKTCLHDLVEVLTWSVIPNIQLQCALPYSIELCNYKLTSPLNHHLHWWGMHAATVLQRKCTCNKLCIMYYAHATVVSSIRFTMSPRYILRHLAITNTNERN